LPTAAARDLADRYGRVDDALLLRMLRDDLGDVDAYVEAVRQLLAGGNDPGGDGR